MPPHFLSKESKVSNCIISGGCHIEGQVESSVIYHGVRIEKDAVVRNSIIMPGAHILKGANINYAIIDENVVIGENSTIGNLNKNPSEPSKSISVIGKDIRLGRNTIIEENNMLELVEVS
jgi:glucose-1-phosphate adenylyltransferase